MKSPETILKSLEFQSNQESKLNSIFVAYSQVLEPLGLDNGYQKTNTQIQRCVFNTQVGSSEENCAKNKLGEISEGGQMHILKCIKRASPMF